MVVSELLASIILCRWCKTRDRLSCEEQVCFPSGRRCVHHISTFHQVLEHHHSYCRPIIVLFPDIRVVLRDSLLKEGVADNFIIIFKVLRTNTSGRVRNITTPYCPIPATRIKTNCPISPLLFNFANNDILETDTQYHRILLSKLLLRETLRP